MEIQMEPQKPLAIFNSMGSRGLSVGISVYDFGIKLPNRDQATAEEFSLIHYDQMGNPTGLKQIKFGVEGVYEAFSPIIRDCLRLHPQNTSNGGSAFMEAPQVAIQQGRGLAGAPGAFMPEEGLTDEDHTILAYLDKIVGKSLMPPAVDNAIKNFHQAVKRFQVTGVRAPLNTERPGRVKVRIEDLMEVLEAAGIKLSVPAEKDPIQENQDPVSTDPAPTVPTDVVTETTESVEQEETFFGPNASPTRETPDERRGDT